MMHVVVMTWPTRVERTVQQRYGTRFRADALLLLPLEQLLREFTRQSLESEFAGRRPDADLALRSVTGLFHRLTDFLQPTQNQSNFK